MLRLLTTYLVFTLFIGMFTSTAQAESKLDYSEVIQAIDLVMQDNHYNPTELKSAAYRDMQVKLKKLAAESTTKEAFVSGFNKLWMSGPFSHVRMNVAQGPAMQMAQYLDQMNVGDKAVQLSWNNAIAILTVNTMMGQDTIIAIQKAYAEISKQNAKAIIIDLRYNDGGAFAIKPLISHLIQEPINAGYFISQNWTSKNDRLPTKSEISEISGWEGWSVLSFWQDVIDQGLIKVQFKPVKPAIKSAVYVLTSKRTASAAELATEALQSPGRVTVIGEPTAGEMLSQKPFDLPGGLHLFLPVADYYSMTTGRIEGNPIQPDIKVPAEQAMATALEQIKTQ